ncbi:diguanylate cyclase (GGDEF) domain-containing protein [Tindallia californiensis]|uniref:Diguanylate cyclase (GGDEF) domain-containing protein n=2 Tax=Tindallia californiensis TaxID=159292 RepID=A0A1H3JZY4_9FIRM|nr:diguanylate cyclase (GGDEF) domain-containing protein [Tindallia californiensis]
MELSMKEFEEATKNQEAFAVLILDIDRFKMVNDGWGHSAGDAVIRELGGLMKTWFHESNVLGRLGGEEFGVLIPKCSMAEAIDIADGFREELARTDIAYDNQIIKVTISVGVSVYTEGVETFGEILRSADEALYQSKIDGRNRVSQKVAGLRER